ncbi:MAG: hypothetical protein R2688_09160 [Fimbriimonadaceae bacterium]
MTVAPQTNPLADVFDHLEVLHPVVVHRAEHDLSLQLVHDIIAVTLGFCRVFGFCRISKSNRQILARLQSLEIREGDVINQREGFVQAIIDFLVIVMAVTSFWIEIPAGFCCFGDELANSFLEFRAAVLPSRISRRIP